jgi:hypothetical protein
MGEGVESWAKRERGGHGNLFENPDVHAVKKISMP